MVGDNSVEPAVILVGQILIALHVERHLQIADTLFKPFRTGLLTRLPEKGVHLVLMGDALEPRHQRARHPTDLPPHLAPQYLVNVDSFLCNLFHFSLQPC